MGKKAVVSHSKMSIHSIVFVRSVGTPSQIAQCAPAPDGEIAVVGRSNVGKSSLINFLAGTTIARTSRTPGRTRLVNIFLVDDRYHFIDLPGYGYASGNDKERRGWAPLIEAFVKARHDLHGFLLLMDARHFPMASDLDAAAWMEELGYPYVVVLTKTDKLSQSEFVKLKRAVPAFCTEHPLARGPIYTSVLKNKGKTELLKAVQELLTTSEEHLQ